MILKAVSNLIYWKKGNHHYAPGFPLMKLCASCIIDAILLAVILWFYYRQHFGIHPDAMILSLKVWKLTRFVLLGTSGPHNFQMDSIISQKFKILRSSGSHEKTLNENPTKHTFPVIVLYLYVSITHRFPSKAQAYHVSALIVHIQIASHSRVQSNSLQRLHKPICEAFS